MRTNSIRVWTAAYLSILWLGHAVCRSEEPASAAPPPPSSSAPPNLLPPTPEPRSEPPHWFDRHSVTPDGQTPPGFGHVDQPLHWTQLGDLYFRIDGGVHKETGFPERESVGFEIDGRWRFPGAPWLSAIGELRNEIVSGGDRLSWMAGGLMEFGPLDQFALGVDGIYDNDGDSHVGSGFLFFSHEIESLNSRIGFWSTFELWDDVRVQTNRINFFVLEEIRSGVEPYEHTSLFYAADLGPEGRWGELYIAPGWEHNHGDFRISTGYQVTIVDGIDAFVHGHYTFDDDRDWTIFAGLQFHLGHGPARPFDFTMPNRIRARQVRETVRERFLSVPVIVFEPFERRREYDPGHSSWE